MKNRYAMICFILMSCVLLNACATSLTISGPPMKEVFLEEETKPGREISSSYRLVEGSDEVTILRRPYCMETAQERIVYRKRLRGVIPAVVEIPLYGLGLVDLVVAKQIAINSKKVEKGDVVETGSIIECGVYKPAKNVELVVQCPETGQMTYVTTGSSGEIALKKLFEGFHLNSQLNIFVREDRCFAYISTLNTSFN